MPVFTCRVLNNQILVNLHNYTGQTIISKSFHISTETPSSMFKKRILQWNANIQLAEEEEEWEGEEEGEGKRRGRGGGGTPSCSWQLFLIAQILKPIHTIFTCTGFNGTFQHYAGSKWLTRWTAASQQLTMKPVLRAPFQSQKLLLPLSLLPLQSVLPPNWYKGPQRPDQLWSKASDIRQNQHGS